MSVVSFKEFVIAEAKDACYHKVKSRYKIFPSAYASGALVKCRKAGADNWGNKSEESASGDSSLHDWFSKSKSSDGKPGWVQLGGKYAGKPCAKQPGQTTKPKCGSSKMKRELSAKQEKSAFLRKNRQDPNPERSGAPINVATEKKKKKIEECWKGYRKDPNDPMKMKGGRQVPNCVPVSEAVDKPHSKGTRVVVSHKGHEKEGRVMRYSPGDSPESSHYIVDVGVYGARKFPADKVRLKEEVDQQIDEALPPPDIRRAVNHGDNVAREHARGYKKAATAYNDAYAKLASQRREPTREQEDELANHFEKAQHHHREFKKRLAQLAARKNEDINEAAKWRRDDLEGKAYDVDKSVDGGKKYPKNHMKMDHLKKRQEYLERARKYVADKVKNPKNARKQNQAYTKYAMKSYTSDWGSKNEEVEQMDEGSAAWQRKEGKNPEGGLNRKGVESYRRENPGSKLQMAVTTKPSKLKPGSKAAKRRKSFCARMGGMPGPMKDEKGRPTRKALSLRKWNC